MAAKQYQQPLFLQEAARLLAEKVWLLYVATLTKGEASSLCKSSAVFVERDLEIEEIAACVEVSDAGDVDGGSGNGI